VKIFPTQAGINFRPEQKNRRFFLPWQALFQPDSDLLQERDRKQGRLILHARPKQPLLWNIWLQD
jgi:hypothetical protein